MNSQKIQDHAEHCDFYVGNEHWDKSYEEKQRLWVEKFAELMIDESVHVLKDLHNQEYGLSEAIERLQHHFGYKPWEKN